MHIKNQALTPLRTVASVLKKNVQMFSFPSPMKMCSPFQFYVQIKSIQFCFITDDI